MALATMYDSASWKDIPIDASDVALYSNGLYAVHPADAKERFPNAQRILWIDVLGNNWVNASILDVEKEDASPDQIPEWVHNRLGEFPDGYARVYCNMSTWPDVKRRVRSLAPYAQRRVRYWIANPTGNIHMVPGAHATQYEWAGDFDKSCFGDHWL